MYALRASSPGVIGADEPPFALPLIEFVVSVNVSVDRPSSAEDMEVRGSAGSASPCARLALFIGENRSTLCGRAAR